MAIRQMKWDCGQCGRTGNPGPKENCPGCGNARGEDVEFYLDKGAPVVTNPNQLREANAGPNWTCEHCQGDNTALAANCDNCGAARGDSPSRRTRTLDLGGQVVSTTKRNSGRDSQKTRSSRGRTHSRKSRTRSRQQLKNDNRALVAFCVVVAAFSIGLLVYLFFFKTEQRTLVVQSHHWERTISVDELRTVTEEDWTVPINGVEVDSWQAIYDYEPVFSHNEDVQVEYQEEVGTYVCGYEDLGNGYARDLECPRYETRYRTEQRPVYRDEPVYRTKYRYEIDRWKHDRDERTSGNADPYWPRVNLGLREREGSRSQRYTLFLRDGDQESYRHNVRQLTWTNLEQGDRVIGIFNAFGVLQKIESPQP